MQRREKWIVALSYSAIILVFLSYEFFNKLTPSYKPLVMSGLVDPHIPTISIFVIPYLSFHILAAFVIPYLSLRIGGFRSFIVNTWAIVFAQIFLDIAYWLFQTEVPRSAIVEKNFFDWALVHVVYGNDRPLNGFPSNHVTWSVISILALWRLRHKAPRLAWGFMAWFMLIIPATVFLKQHFLIDIYGGIFVACATYWATLFKVERINLSLHQ